MVSFKARIIQPALIKCCNTRQSQRLVNKGKGRQGRGPQYEVYVYESVKERNLLVRFKKKIKKKKAGLARWFSR